MLFNIGGYFINTSFILFAFWNLTIMWQAFGMDREEQKSFMSNKKEIESKSRFLKPARLLGYGCLIAGLLIYISGYLF